MSYAIVYSSQTGNTKMLADAVRKALPEEECIYFGTPDAKALEAEKLYVGFWTDKGTCDAATAEFLKTLTDQKVFLFGTAGFGGSKEYFNKILTSTASNMPASVKKTGTYMCQGKMPIAVRNRYKKMLEDSSNKIPNIPQLIENFDRALSHPDKDDLMGVFEAVRSN